MLAQLPIWAHIPLRSLFTGHDTGVTRSTHSTGYAPLLQAPDDAVGIGSSSPHNQEEESQKKDANTS